MLLEDSEADLRHEGTEVHKQQSLPECKEQLCSTSSAAHTADLLHSVSFTLLMHVQIVMTYDILLQAIEATLYATLMSISNASGGVSEVLGAALSKILGITAHQFGNMSWLVLICTLSNLLSLPFLNLVPDINEHTALSSIEH